MGLRPLEVFILLPAYGAGIDFSRQNLTSTDVRFCRLSRRQILTTKFDPRTVRVEIIYILPFISPALRSEALAVYVVVSTPFRGYEL